MNMYALIAIAITLFTAPLMNGAGNKYSFYSLKNRETKKQISRLDRYRRKGSITPAQQLQLRALKNQLKSTTRNTQSDMIHAEPRYLFIEPAGKQRSIRIPN